MNTVTNFITTLTPNELAFTAVGAAAVLFVGAVLLLLACRTNSKLQDENDDLAEENEELSEEVSDLQNRYATTERKLTQLRKVLAEAGIEVVFKDDIRSPRRGEPRNVDELLRGLFGNEIVDKYNAHARANGEPETTASPLEQAMFGARLREEEGFAERKRAEYQQGMTGETIAPEFERTDAPDVAQPRDNGCCGGQCGG